MADHSRRVVALVVGAFLTIAGLFLAGPALAQDSLHAAPPIPTTGTAEVTVSKAIDQPGSNSSFLLTASPVNLTDPTGTTTKYQWYRVSLTSGSSSAITGATSISYRPTTSDYPYKIKVRATVTKSGYATLVVYSAAKDYSLRLDPTTPLQAQYDHPCVDCTDYPAAFNVLREEENGSVTTVSYSSISTYNYEWYRTGSTTKLGGPYSYSAKAADVGHRLYFKATLKIDGWLPLLKKTSATTEEVERNYFSGLGTPPISQSGLVLTVDPSGVTPTPTVTYQWYRNGSAVTGRTAATYTLGSSDFGKEVTVKVTYKRPGYETAVRDGASDNGNDTWYVAAAPAAPVIEATNAENDVYVGATLRIAARTYENSHTATDLDSGNAADLTMKYQWYRDGTAVNGQDGPTYAVTNADKGKAISVKVSAIDPDGLLVSSVATSAATKPIGTSPIAGAGAATLSVTKTTPTATSVVLDADLTGITELGATVKYQWYRDSTAVTGKTAETYTLSTADRGKDVWVRVTVSKAAVGSTTYTSVVYNSTPLDYTVMPGTSPAPYLSGSNWTVGTGIGVYGLNFVTKDGPIASPDDIQYQWLRNGSPISGATSDSYFLVAADYGTKITVRLTVKEQGYVSLSQTVTDSPASIAKGITTSTPVAEIVPAGPGKIKAQLVSGTLVPADPAPKYAYQWYRDGKAIDGATSQTRTLTSSDRGKLLTVKITVKRTNFTVSTLTLAKPTAAAYWIVGTSEIPTISGTAKIGQQLTAASTATYVDAEYSLPITPTLSYTWYRDGSAISGQSASTYTLTSSDLGKKISVKVTARYDGLYAFTSAASLPTAKVLTDAVDPGTLEPVVDGAVDFATSSKVQVTLSGTPGTTGTITYSYQWYRHADSTSGSAKTAISGATGTTYTLTDADTGKLVTVVVTLKKTGFTTTVLAEVPANEIPYHEPIYTQVDGSNASTATVGQSVSAVAPLFYLADDSTNVDSGDVAYQWLLNGVAAVGKTSYLYGSTSALSSGDVLTLQVTVTHAKHAVRVLTSDPVTLT